MASVFIQRVRGDAGNVLGDIAAMSNMAIQRPLPHHLRISSAKGIEYD
jgi:hypothetical protein